MRRVVFKQDDKQAVYWFGKAAEQGNVYAQKNLGVMYANGQGVAKDDKQAAYWYGKAAEQGNAVAQNNLGWMYADGRDVIQDYSRAVALFRKSAEQGEAYGQRGLGLSYRDGKGVSENPIMAYVWLNLSVAGGHSSAGEERDAVADKLTRAELAQAQKLSSAWEPGKVMPEVKYHKATPPAPPAVSIKPTKVAQPVASADAFPPPPPKRTSAITCSTRCVNSSCVRTYSDGRKVKFQAKHVYDQFSGDWKWDSGSC